MKKRSANAERKKRLKANRAKIRQRFQANTDQPEPGLSPFNLFGNLILRNKSAIFYGLSVIITIASMLGGFNIYQQTHRPDFSKQICEIDSAEFRTMATAKDLEEKPSELHQQLSKIIKDAPMSEMIGDIAKKDRAVAAYLVGIAMKESKYGTYAPKKDGADCYNYWGYRGKENTTKSGYSCFDSPAHAVAVVGGKIESMLKYGPRTPAQMISWKCGSTCAGHDPASVTKWIADVSINYYLINPDKKFAKRN